MTAVPVGLDPLVRALSERIERLEEVAERFDHPEGSRRLARRARDKAEGLRVALRLVKANRGQCRECGGSPASCLVSRIKCCPDCTHTSGQLVAVAHERYQASS